MKGGEDAYLPEWKFDQDDQSKLKTSVLQHVVKTDDVYRTSNPKELKKFRSYLKTTDEYDVVVDGLNVALSASDIHDSRGKSLSTQSLRVSSDSDWLRSNLDCPIFLQLRAVLRQLQKRGLKPLVIHRKSIKHYPDYEELKKLAQIFIMDRE